MSLGSRIILCAALLTVSCFAGTVLPGAYGIDPNDPSGICPTDTGETLIFLSPGTDWTLFAKDYGLTILRPICDDNASFVMSWGTVDAGRDALLRMQTDSRLRAGFMNRLTSNVPYGFVPDDAYFHRDTPTPGHRGQWNLVNEYNTGVDARVQFAWDCTITGAGVPIGVVDDCLETLHPDLAPNYSKEDSNNFVRLVDANQGASPDPVYPSDWHGPPVAGIAGARGGNGLGVTGVAPYALLGGLRITYDPDIQTDEMFVRATLYNSSGGNTSIKVKNHSYGIAVPYIPDGGCSEALSQSAASGTIHCFAAGNGRLYFLKDLYQDSGKNCIRNNPAAIVVAAMGSNGKYAWYSSFGGNVMVTAPSADDVGFLITTTSRLGYGDFPGGSYDYTYTFGGTSAASPTFAD